MARYTQMRRWEPFRDLLQMQRDVNRLFGAEDDFGFNGTWAPLMDIHEGSDAYTLSLDVPGMTSDDIEVTFDRGVLTIRGERRFLGEDKAEQYRRVERHYGAFERSVTLPAPVDAEGINASVHDGVLEITVPKAEEAKPRQIKIGEGARQLEA